VFQWWCHGDEDYRRYSVRGMRQRREHSIPDAASTMKLQNHISAQCKAPLFSPSPAEIGSTRPQKCLDPRIQRSSHPQPSHPPPATHTSGQRSIEDCFPPMTYRSFVSHGTRAPVVATYQILMINYAQGAVYVNNQLVVIFRHHNADSAISAKFPSLFHYYCYAQPFSIPRTIT
jgi:hypothetical protein